MDERARKRRARRGRYPLVVGIIGLGAALAPTFFGGVDPAPLSDGDAAVAGDAASNPSPSRIRGRLWWRVAGHTRLPEPSTLTQCVRQAGYGPVLTTRSSDGSDPARPPRVEIIHPKLPGPVAISLEREHAAVLDLRTPVGEDRRLPIALHLAIAACLRDGATGLIDPDLGRRFEIHAWPAATSRGGMPVDAFIDIQHRSGIVTTLGLARLDLPELALLATDDPDADAHTVRYAASAVIAGGVTIPGPVGLTEGVEARIMSVAALQGARWLPTSVAQAGDSLAFLLDPDPASPRPLSRRVRSPKPAANGRRPLPARRAARPPRANAHPKPNRSPDLGSEVPPRQPAAKPFMPDYR